MRPGRASDLPGLVELWRSEVRAGLRDSIPPEPQVQGMLAQFDWGARSRMVEDEAAALAGAVMVSSRPSPEGIVARIDPAVASRAGTALVMRDLVQWGLQLSRAAGAAAAQVWVGPGQAGLLQGLGLEMVRPWWRMDRTLAGRCPRRSPSPATGSSTARACPRVRGLPCTTGHSPTTGDFLQEPRKSSSSGSRLSCA